MFPIFLRKPFLLSFSALHNDKLQRIVMHRLAAAIFCNLKQFNFNFFGMRSVGSDCISS